MKDNYKKIKNMLVLEAIIKIICYSIITFFVFFLVVDVFYNNEIANEVSNFNRELYVFLVRNKSIILIIFTFIITLIFTFLEIRKLGENITIILKQIDKIAKNPDHEIDIKSSLYYAESSLNEMRLEIVRKREKAAEEEKKKNDLIMYMAHDIKTPLTSTIGYLTLLKDEKVSSELQDKYLNIALRKALRVEELTNEFFEITKFNLHNIELNKENIDLVMLLQQLVEEFMPMFTSKNLTCKINASKSISYYGDGDKLARAFGNIIKNAVNYCYENTKIEISASKNNDEIVISFKNKGKVIPKYKIDKIFELFYRGDSNRNSGSGGSGLGLAICRDIITLHGGKIECISKDEETEFKITL